MRCLGREVRSQKDYLLGTDRRLLWNVSIRDPWNNSDHFMVLGFLQGVAKLEHTRYLRQRQKSPICPRGSRLRSTGGLPP